MKKRKLQLAANIECHLRGQFLFRSREKKLKNRVDVAVIDKMHVNVIELGWLERILGEEKKNKLEVSTEELNKSQDMFILGELIRRGLVEIKLNRGITKLSLPIAVVFSLESNDYTVTEAPPLTGKIVMDRGDVLPLRACPICKRKEIGKYDLLDCCNRQGEVLCSYCGTRKKSRCIVIHKSDCDRPDIHLCRATEVSISEVPGIFFLDRFYESDRLDSFYDDALDHYETLPERGIEVLAAKEDEWAGVSADLDDHFYDPNEEWSLPDCLRDEFQKLIEGFNQRAKSQIPKQYVVDFNKKVLFSPEEIRGDEG